MKYWKVKLQAEGLTFRSCEEGKDKAAAVKAAKVAAGPTFADAKGVVVPLVHPKDATDADKLAAIVAWQKNGT